MADVFEAEAQPAIVSRPADVAEVENYIAAMNHGLHRLREDGFPISARLIREIHARLMQGVRGADRAPGEFRRTQNFIGPRGCTIQTATFVPPPANQISELIANLEQFMHSKDRIPTLIKAAAIHAQFETIHPFLDGNGRLGRLLITFFLCHQSILRKPLLYLSSYFMNNRLLYYEKLQAVHDTGDWEGWITFFLQGVESVAHDASHNARRIVSLRERHRATVQSHFGRNTSAALALLDLLYAHPIVSAKNVAKFMEVVPATAHSLLKSFADAGILRLRGERKRNKTYIYHEYWQIFSEDRSAE
jgi:Fic family protein